MSLLIYILIKALDIYQIIIVIACVLSFVPIHHPLLRKISLVVWMLSAPAFGFIQRFLPFLRLGVVDLSPMVLILAIYALKIALIQLL